MSRSRGVPGRNVKAPILGVLAAILAGLMGPGAASALSPVGPWGGVIHDLARSGTAGTLYAATGNGIYRRGTGESRWQSFPATLGFRVLDLALDPSDAGVAYAVALPSSTIFSFNETEYDSEPPWGTVHRLDLHTGVFTSLEVNEASALAVTRDGTLVVGTRWGQIRARNGPDTLGSRSVTYPVRDLAAFGDTVWAAVGRADSTLQYGGLWTGHYPENNWYLDGAAGYYCRSIGGYAGTLVAGLHDRKAMRKGGDGTWSALGPAGLSALYPVTAIGTGPDGTLFAVQRMHNWWGLDVPTAPPPGLFRYDPLADGWISCDTAAVSTAVGKVLADGNDLLVAFDLAGIRRVPSVDGQLRFTGCEEWDEGIGAVSLNGISPIPRGPRRAVAYGPSGVYELQEGNWRRLTMAHLTNVKDATYGYQLSGQALTVQSARIREGEMLSAAYTPRTPPGLWVGTDTCLLFGSLLPGESGTWRSVFQKTAGVSNGTVYKVRADPFADDDLWWASGAGIHHTHDGGATRETLQPSIGFRDIVFDPLPPGERMYVGAYTNLDGGLRWSCDGTSWSLTVAQADKDFSSLAVSSSPEWTQEVFFAAPTGDGIPLALERSTMDFPAGMQEPYGFGELVGKQFISIDLPMGKDTVGSPDAYAIVEGFDLNDWCWYRRIYHSEALSGFPPGESWEEIGYDPEKVDPQLLVPTSLAADPRDGSLLWVATRHGSAYTLKTAFFSDETDPDFPPPAVPDARSLQVVDRTAGTITLGWTAPGDDGHLPGWADRYELRVNYYPLPSSASFPSWGWTVGIPAPAIAHREEYATLDISAYSASFITFALAAYDDLNHPSPILTTGLFRAATLPAVQSLCATASRHSVELSWDLGALGSDPAFTGSGSILIFRTAREGPERLVTTLWPNSTGWTDDGADLGGFQAQETVYYRVHARVSAGDFSNASCQATIPQSTGGGGGGGGGGCFIATAAFGTPMQPEVEVLRIYRERYLKQRAWGRGLVRFYEALSPAPAGLIAGSPLLRASARAALSPVIWCVGITDASGPWAVLMGLGVLALPWMLGGAICLAAAGRMRRNP